MAFSPFNPQTETTLLKDKFHWTPGEMSLDTLMAYLRASFADVSERRDNIRTVVFNTNAANAMPENYARDIRKHLGLTVKVDDTLGPMEFRFGY